ncbi:hypothetical protein [Actinotalea sp. K2]|uniref:hypothetical protein n=1 Tax=Actinotalea sp. K2 TaxID=2939438 RepID=UPI002017753C|nr:hypothetical protein [Actinotalea sp. K2]MCL3862180.1 hypothetical protein [Actinotalea sp. K2]
MARARQIPAGCPRSPERTRAVVTGLSVLLLALTGCAATPEEPVDQSPQTTATAREQEPAEQAPDETLVAPTPDQHSEVGSLVEGFPVDLLPLPQDAVILVTSAVPVGDADVQEVSLNLRTAMSSDEILTTYRDALTAAGFAELPETSPQSDLAVESTFTRSGGDELVSIGVLDTDSGRTVSIGGRIRSQG